MTRRHIPTRLILAAAHDLAAAILAVPAWLLPERKRAWCRTCGGPM